MQRSKKGRNKNFSVDNMMIFIEFSEISKVLESIVLVQQENRI